MALSTSGVRTSTWSIEREQPLPEAPPSCDNPGVAKQRRLCVAVDVEGYSRSTVPGQRHTQAALRGVLDAAWAGRAVDRQPNGDGEVALVAADVDEADVLAHVVRSMDTGARAAGLRLRLAAHAGLAALGHNGFIGHAVVRTCRMLDSAVLRRALAEHRGPGAVAMVSESLYEDVVALDRAELAAREFRPVDITGPGFRARAFLRAAVPQGGVDAVPPTFQVIVADGGEVGTVVQIGTWYGGPGTRPLP